MYDDGYHNIVNIDFSKTVIRNMTEKCKDRVGMECKDVDKTLPLYISAHSEASGSLGGPT